MQQIISMARRKNIPLAPVTTTKRHNLRTGRRETWAAATVDGVYAIERIEDEGTSWITIRLADGKEVDFCGTLRVARYHIAMGQVAL
jgi:hypothetical protein